MAPHTKAPSSSVDLRDRDRSALTDAFVRASKDTAATVCVTSTLGTWRVSLSPLLAPTGAAHDVGGCVEIEDERTTTVQVPSYDPIAGALTHGATLDTLVGLITRGSPTGGVTASAVG
jgi:hypothetical protein